jgi:spore maturation protein CgeB
VLCVFGRHAYGDPARGESYEHANLMPALSALGHEVDVFDSFDRSVHPNFAELNRALLAKVTAWKPDLLLCVLMHYEVWRETLLAVRERCGAAVLNWGTDDSWKYAQFTRYVARSVDLYATTSHEALRLAHAEGLKNVVLTQWAASDAVLAEPLPAKSCDYGVSFVGAAYGNRRRWIDQLAARGIEVQCFGHGWPNGPVDTAALRAITRRSVISLNFGDSGLQWKGALPYRSRQIKARVFEVPGAGGLLLTQPAEHLDHYYRIGQEIDVFNSADELAAKIREYLHDGPRRDAIAHAGHARTRGEHTYTRRLAPLLERAAALARTRDSAVHRYEPEEFTAMAKAHSPSTGLRLLKTLLVIPLSLVFGRVRGPRAARRLLFELSWRLAGSYTYSVRGWPGRLFYRES